MLKIKDNVDLERIKIKLEILIKDLELIIEYAEGEDASRYDKMYAECAKNVLKTIEELGLVEKMED